MGADRGAGRLGPEVARRTPGPRPLQELHAALGTVVDDDAVRSVALTGAGPGFCAGLDLGEVQALRTDPEKARLSGDIL